jgi:hypothetical protein
MVTVSQNLQTLVSIWGVLASSQKQFLLSAGGGKQGRGVKASSLFVSRMNLFARFYAELTLNLFNDFRLEEDNFSDS